ncbi:uncharacterized protein LOC110463334 [Mizuhopecten yessoensis]|uniref:Speriolin n=1 Tax=Mizuhopecten yessoensis TaxID=6573 RepID=A0A210PWF2_MIZYE|nr:uncharacterized protein LOC110463334 [Mizuhopecten yessoensis]OWF40782.1 Speriolin [Mizuhopecten yessoensis]
MSVWNDRFQTLGPGDLFSQTLPGAAEVLRSENTLPKGADRVLWTENARLKEENRQLRKCLVSMSENASLRTAHVLASLLVWSDEQMTGQAKKFLATDTVNNDDVKMKPSPAVSPFRPISPGPMQQSNQYSHDPPKEFSSTMSNRSYQYASVPPTQNSQYTYGSTQQTSQHGSVPNRQSRHFSDRDSSALISVPPKDGSLESAQRLQISGASKKESPRRYSPSNDTDDVPFVVLMPSTPTPADRRQISRSPIPSNRSPVPSGRPPLPRNKSPVPSGGSHLPRSKSPVPSGRSPLPRSKSPVPSGRSPLPRSQSPLQRSRSPVQRSMTTGQSGNKVPTPTVNNRREQPYTNRRNTMETKSAERTSNLKYPDPASDIDDRLEKLLSRQITIEEYAPMSATGQGQYQTHFEMPGSSFSVGIGDRRVAVSGYLDQTGSEGYGSVPSSLGQFGQPERLSSENIKSGLDVGQYGGDTARAASFPASVTRKAVGDPIATSTPVRPAKPGSTADAGHYGDSLEQSLSSQKQSVTASRITASSNVLNRPIDSVIGFKPILTESRCQKIAKIRASKRLVGEIAFQLDRRILEHVFSWKSVSDKEKRKRYYGYSIANTGQMIRKEATDEMGKVNVRKEIEMRYRFDFIMKTLSSFGYNLEKHGQFSQDMVNNYGLLNAPPDKQTVEDFGLEDPVILRVLLSKLLRSDAELQNELVLLDCLCLLAHDDRKPIFLW